MRARKTVALRVLQGFDRSLPPQIFTDGDEFHLGSDDPLLCIVHLSDRFSRFGAQRMAAQSRKFFEPSSGFIARICRFFERSIAIINGLHETPFILCDIAARENPWLPEWRETIAYIAGERWIAPRTARLVNTDRAVFLNCPIETLRRMLAYFAERNVDLRISAVNIYSF